MRSIGSPGCGGFEWKALGKANGKGRQCEALAVPAAERLNGRLWVRPMDVEVGVVKRSRQSRLWVNPMAMADNA